MPDAVIPMTFWYSERERGAEDDFEQAGLDEPIVLGHNKLTISILLRLRDLRLNYPLDEFRRAPTKEWFERLDNSRHISVGSVWSLISRSSCIIG